MEKAAGEFGVISEAGVLKRLIAGAGRVIFLIVDRGPSEIARTTRAFVESPNGSPRLFRSQPRRAGVEGSRSGHRRRHGDHEQGCLQGQGPFVHAPASKQPGKNLLFLPKALTQIRRLNIELFTN